MSVNDTAGYGSATDSERTPLVAPEPAEKKVTRASLKIRWLVLTLSSLMLVGNYYCYDNPSALKTQLHEYFKGTSTGGDQWETNFALMYSVYSFPNTVLPFFGGFLVDYLGMRLMSIIFVGFITIGQVVFAVGTAMKSLPILLAGRVIFGFGGESITVASSALLSFWFQDKELALALGVNLGCARLGGVANNYISPMLWDDHHLSMWVGAMICGGSLACAIAMASIDKVAESRLKKINASAEKLNPSDVEPPVKLSDVRHFALPFWLLTLSCLVIYGTVLPFNNVASTFLQQRDFMVQEYPWKDNRSFVAPVCESADPAPDKMVLRACNSSVNPYLGTFFVGAVFVNPDNASEVFPMGQAVSVACVSGYKQVKAGENMSATCTATQSSDTWSGTAYWNVTNGNGCVPSDDATRCDLSSQALALGIDPSSSDNAATCLAQSACYEIVSKMPSGGYDACDTDSIALQCNTTTGLYEYTTDSKCFPVLYEPKEYCNELNDAEIKANQVMSIPYIISIVLSPILGFCVDKIGKRATLATAASLTLIAVHTSLAVSDVTPYVPLVGQGLAYSVFAAALWPSVPYAVDQQYVGTAYGVMTAVQNSGLAVFPLAVSKILSPCSNNPPESTGDILSESVFESCQNSINRYKDSELFFVGLAVFGTMVGFWLYFDDKINRKSVLERSSSAAKAADSGVYTKIAADAKVN